MKTDNDITELLQAWRAGDDLAENKLFSEVYQVLKTISANRFSADGSSLNTTELVHEGFLILSQKRKIDWQNRKHFFAIAATILRRLVVDHLRAEQSQKRGGASEHVSILDVSVPSPDINLGWIDLDNGLLELEAFDHLSVKVVELHMILGLTVRECSSLLNISTAAVSRKWHFSRSWLHNRLQC